MQITGKQIRAARVLAEWSASDLGPKIGINPVSLQNIERGEVIPRASTIEKIIKVFSSQSIEFTAYEGVRFRPEGLEILSGADGIKAFSDNIYAYAQTSGGVLRQNCIEDDVFFACAETIAKDHSERMAALKKSREDILVKVLVPSNVAEFKCPEYAEYKWFPKNAPIAIPFYVFGNTVGIFALDVDSTPKIYQIASPIIAATYTKQFDSSWEMATDPFSNKKHGRKK